MAKTKARKGETGQLLSRLQSNMKQLQRDAERLMQRTRKQAAQLISRDQRRALDRILTQAKKLRGDLEKRAERASKDVESRAERLLTTIEKETAKRVAPLLKRLDLPSRQEVQALSRRIGQLEKRLHSKRPTPPPRSEAPTLTPVAPTPTSVSE
jgi:F0F1-type ATP synthase membrane subunit b/b'